MKAPFCIIGATRATGLLIAQQLLERGSNVKVVVRDPGKASRFLVNRTGRGLTQDL
jgi:Trk K+ transport system NAD-binding subunit